MYVCLYVCLYVRMYVCMLNCIYVCMYLCMYVCMHVCISTVCILFNISHHLSGSLVSVGVGSWCCMLKGPGSNHLCELRELSAGIVFLGGGGGVTNKF